MSIDSSIPAGRRRERGTRPVRAGAVPALADGFSAPPETAAGLTESLLPGAVVLLVPDRVAKGRSLGWVPIPAAVFTTPAACDYVAGRTTVPATAERAQVALLMAEQVGLLSTGPMPNREKFSDDSFES